MTPEQKAEHHKIAVAWEAEQKAKEWAALTPQQREERIRLATFYREQQKAKDKHT